MGALAIIVFFAGFCWSYATQCFSMCSNPAALMEWSFWTGFVFIFIFWLMARPDEKKNKRKNND